MKTWDQLSKDEQNLYLTLLWEDGYSERAIARFFSTTKGRIVKRRQAVLKLPTHNRHPVKSVVNPDRFKDLLDLYLMQQLEARGVAALTPPTPVEREHEARSTDLEKYMEHDETKTRLPQGDKHLVVPEEEVIPQTCKWPLASSTRQKTVYCGKPAVAGHNLCEDHRRQALRYKI